MADNTRYDNHAQCEKKIASLKRKVAKLAAERDWAEQERAITERWAEQSWEQVRHLRALLEKAIQANQSLPVVIPNQAPLPNPLPPPVWSSTTTTDTTPMPFPGTTYTCAEVER